MPVDTVVTNNVNKHQLILIDQNLLRDGVKKKLLLAGMSVNRGGGQTPCPQLSKKKFLKRAKDAEFSETDGWKNMQFDTANNKKECAS